MIILALVQRLALLALLNPPEPEPAPAPAPAGGFGTVDSVTIESNVHAPPPPAVEASEDKDDGPRTELSARVEAGYAQTNLRNTSGLDQGLDHHGLFLRLHLMFYPWVSKRRRVAGGIGALYSYAGVNRWKLPDSVELERSEAQQQQIMLSMNLLVRPHPEWFSIQPSGMFGLGFYSNALVFAADRPATIRKDEYAFVVGGSLALCTAWDIACVIGGSELLVAIETIGTDALDSRVINPWGWHVGVGVDILRIMARANRVAG